MCTQKMMHSSICQIKVNLIIKLTYTASSVSETTKFFEEFCMVEFVKSSKSAYAPTSIV